MMPLDPEKVEEFRTLLRGPLMLPGESGYDEARKIWNGMIDRHPPAIVRATGNADVIAAVNFARENEFPVSVKGGGHSAAGTAVSDEALMIDLSLMNGVHVDAKTRRGRAQGGVTWGLFDRECQIHGVATTGGFISTTGVGGLTLGGGLGWLMGKYGLTIDNLLSADIVTAQGELLTTSASENSDLFWALRGGSGNFGIVTSFEFQLHPVGPMITGGVAAWPVDKGREVLDFFKSYVQSAPEEVTAFCAMAGAPDRSGNLIAAIFAAHCGSLEDGAAALQPIKEFGPAMDMIGPIPYTAQQSMVDEGFPPGELIYWKSAFLRELSEEAIEIVARKGAELPTPASAIVLEHFHGAVNRVSSDATAFPGRGAAFNVVIIGSCSETADQDRCRAWARSVYDDLQPYTTGGVYVNYLGVDDDAERVLAAYGTNYEKLAGVKQKYDPENLFRANQNIKPGAQTGT